MILIITNAFIIHFITNKKRRTFALDIFNLFYKQIRFQIKNKERKKKRQIDIIKNQKVNNISAVRYRFI